MSEELERKLKEHQEQQLDEDISNLLQEIGAVSRELMDVDLKASEEINRSGLKLLDQFLDRKEKSIFKQKLLALAARARELKKENGI